ncbi:hypothetical protein [EBPR podovirus 2]|nr:hypothetical protein [EBPR podovirus 2]
MTDDLKERLKVVARCDTDSTMRYFAYAVMEQDPDGDYVTYIAARAHITDLEARLAAAETEIIRLEQEALRLREELLEQRGAKAEAAAMMREAEAERDAALAQVAMTVFCADCENTTTRTDDDRCSVCGSGRIMVGKAPSAALSRRDAQMRAEGRKDGLREAAEWIESVPQSLPNRQEYASHLRALAEKEAGNG